MSSKPMSKEEEIEAAYAAISGVVSPAAIIPKPPSVASVNALLKEEGRFNTAMLVTQIKLAQHRQTNNRKFLKK